MGRGAGLQVVCKMRGNEVGGVWAVGGASSRAGSGGVAMGRWAGLRGRGVVVGVAMRLGAESGVPNGTGLGAWPQQRRGQARGGRGQGKSGWGPRFGGVVRTTPPHTQVEELSGQRAAAALQVERWQRECRSLQERFEALSQEREVRPPSPRPPHLQDPPHPPLHPLWFPVPVPEAAGGARCSARGQRGAALCSGAAELLAAGR